MAVPQSTYNRESIFRIEISGVIDVSTPGAATPLTDLNAQAKISVWDGNNNEVVTAQSMTYYDSGHTGTNANEWYYDLPATVTVLGGSLYVEAIVYDLVGTTRRRTFTGQFYDGG